MKYLVKYRNQLPLFSAIIFIVVYSTVFYLLSLGITYKDNFGTFFEFVSIFGFYILIFGLPIWVGISKNYLERLDNKIQNYIKNNNII